MVLDPYTERCVEELTGLLHRMQDDRQLDSCLPQASDLMHHLAWRFTGAPSTDGQIHRVVQGGPNALHEVLRQYHAAQLHTRDQLIRSRG